MFFTPHWENFVQKTYDIYTSLVSRTKTLKFDICAIILVRLAALSLTHPTTFYIAIDFILENAKGHTLYTYITMLNKRLVL